MQSDVTASPRHWDKVLPRGRQYGEVDSDEDSGSVDDSTKDRSGVDLDDPMVSGTTLQDTAVPGGEPSESAIFHHVQALMSKSSVRSYQTLVLCGVMNAKCGCIVRSGSSYTKKIRSTKETSKDRCDK